MIRDIQKCSTQYLQNILSPLDQYTNYVFWIRNRELTHQIFTSKNYENIWQRPLDLLYEIPFLWFDYLNPDGKSNALKQLDTRHHHLYADPKKNFAYYQIILPDNSLRYIRCHCFKCGAVSGQQYIIGMSKNITPEIWHPAYQNYNDETDQDDKAVQEHFFTILNQAFAITPITPLISRHTKLIRIRNFLIDTQNIILSERELECIYHLCHGRTAKVTARELGISSRTVETYIENILVKTKCINKLEVVGRFASYFFESDLTDNSLSF